MTIGNKINELYANMDVPITVTNYSARCDRRLAQQSVAVAPNIIYLCSKTLWVWVQM